jgi:hypothetical protein
MTPEISEFSYGFALTNEIVGWAPIAAAPLFPSLIEEGKAGGGYDVKLDMPAAPLYLQFKRADCMLRGTAREIKDYKLALSIPFYRFKITEAGKSDQHELLLALDDGFAMVYYAAPRFHELAEINDAWISNSVASRSIFIAPRTIGALDNSSHHVAYDRDSAWLCSEPKKIESLNSQDMLQKLQSAIAMDPRPLRDKIPEFLEGLRSAEELARSRIVERKSPTVVQGFPFSEREIQSVRTIPVREPLDLPEPEQKLREAADIAGRLFDAQLIIVQPVS